MTDLMRQAGFTDCRYRSLTFGTLTIYLATRP
jgi:ubiquinone/menaquinone biosynthesis C-methylase UbiE